MILSVLRVDFFGLFMRSSSIHETTRYFKLVL